MKYLFIYLFFLLNIQSVFSQNTEDFTDQAWRDILNNPNAIPPVMVKGSSEIKGSPFLNNEWTLGSVVTKDSSVLGGASLKYNIYSDELYFTNRRVNKTVVLDTSVVQAFQLKDSLKEVRTFQYLKFGVEMEELGLVSGYYEVLYDGKTKLFLKYSKSLIEADYTGAYNSGKRYDEFQNNSVKYYFKKSDNTWYRLSKSKSSFEKAMKDKGDEVIDYIKTNKLKLKNVEEIIKVVEYYDSL